MTVPGSGSNPFLRFHRAAEAAGYPALQVATMMCLGIVVAPIGLLAATRAAWALGLALFSLVVAVALLAGAIEAALADRDQHADTQDAAGEVADEPRPVVPLRRRRLAAHRGDEERRAA
jgi:hypothetical protein